MIRFNPKVLGPTATSEWTFSSNKLVMIHEITFLTGKLKVLLATYSHKMQKFQFHKIEGVGSFDHRLSYDTRCVAGDVLYVSIIQALHCCPLQMKMLVLSKSKLTTDIDYSGNVRNKNWLICEGYSFWAKTQLCFCSSGIREWTCQYFTTTEHSH